MKDKDQDSKKEVQKSKYWKAKNTPKNWLCHLLGHSLDCERCDPERETQPLLGRKIRRYQSVE